MPNGPDARSWRRSGRVFALGVPMVGEHATKSFRQLVAVGRDLEPGPHQVDLGRRLAEGSVLEHVDTRAAGQWPSPRRSQAGEVHEEQRVTIPDEEPRAVVVGRTEVRQERCDGVGRGGMSGELERQFATGPFRGILGVAQGLVRQPGADTVLVDGEPRPAGHLVPTAQDTRWSLREAP